MRHPIIQRHLVTVAIATSLTSTLLALPSFARSISPQLSSSINAALNYPTSSQRFFNEGQQRFEQEIQQLRDTPEHPTEPLQINERLPELLEQQRLQLEQPHERSQNETAPQSPNAL